MKKFEEKKLIDPPKWAFLSFEIKNKQKIFLHIFLLSLKTTDAQMLFRSVFLKTHKKKKLTAKMAFLGVNNFFCAFSKIPIKRTFVRLLFLKLNQGRNTKKFFFLGFSISTKTKNALFWGSKMVLLKLVFLRLFSNVKGSSIAILIKKY